MAIRKNFFDGLTPALVGLIFDGRNRPIALSKESDKRINSLLNWSQAVDEYPKGELF